MKKNIFLIPFFLFSIFSSFPLSQVLGATDWWLTPRTQTQTSYQYVAYTEGEENSEDLKERAFAQATSMLVREHFGLSVEASEVIIEETEGAQFQFMTKLKSEAIKLKGLKLIQIHEVKKENLFRVYVQIEMSMSDLQKSKKQNGVDGVEHTYGEAKQYESSVVVKTSPAGAMIEFSSITKKYFVSGYGNAKFYLPIDTYEMQIHLPGHHIIQRRVKVLTKTLELVYLLSPIYGELQLKLTPKEAIIEKLQPVKGENPFYLPLDRSFRFKISHPDYYDKIVETEINEESVTVKDIVLKPRTSSLRIQVIPKEAVIKLNESIIKNNERVKVESGMIGLEVGSKGFQSYQETVEVSPNREYPTKIIRLTQAKQSVKGSSKIDFRLEFNPVLSMGGESSFTPIGLGGHFQWEYLSLGAQLNSGVATKDTGNGKEEKSIADFCFQLRVLVFRTEKTLWYLSGVLGAYSKDKEWVYESSEDTMTKYKYNGGGIGFRYQFTNKFSAHIEYNFISQQELDKDDRKIKDQGSKSSARAIIGVGYDF